jgi:hypothetical protein
MLAKSLNSNQVTTHLQSVVEVANLAQTVEELVDPRLVILNEWIQRDHICLLCVRRLICKVLEHLCYLQNARLRGIHGAYSHQRQLTSVNVRRGCFAGTPSTNMYAWGVTIAGLMKRRKKKPPMREQMA